MANAKSKLGTVARKHHKQSDFCYKRPAYREAKWERAVKVYTINQESKYLLVQGVPSVGVTKELVELFAIYGAIEEYRYLDEYPCEQFTDVYWIKFQKIQAARYAKKKLDMRSFYGGILHVCYAPEYETVDDTREKLNERRRLVARKCREYYPESEASYNESTSQKVENKDGNTASSSSYDRSLNIIDSYTEPKTVHESVGSPEVPSQASSQFPQLPLPPMHLPPSFLPPPPPPPMPLEYPRVPTKNATVPLELQSYGYGSKPTVESNPPHPVEKTQQALPNETCIGTKRPLEAQSESTSIALGNRESSSNKRIVWHKQPGASVSASHGNVSQAEPGAWDPFAVQRKQLKSLCPGSTSNSKATGDQRLDDVALRIREQLKKTTDFKYTPTESERKGHSDIGQQVKDPPKKTRKRI